MTAADPLLTVKEVKTCACGCGEIPTAGREYCWGHKGGMKGEKARAAAAPGPALPATIGDIVTVRNPKRFQFANAATTTTDPDVVAAIAQLTIKRDKLNKAIQALEGLL